MNRLFSFILSATGGEGNQETSSGTTEKLKEALGQMVKSPIFYIVIGALVLLVIAIYLIRRIVKPTPGVVKVITRGGQIFKLVDEKETNHFLVPFKERLSAVISLSEKEFGSDKLFINNGPDALYKINYTLKYKIVKVAKFYPYRESFQNSAITKINDKLREYADNGHALEIVKDYREHSKELLSLINSCVEECGIEVTLFKINYIEPLGRK